MICAVRLLFESPARRIVTVMRFTALSFLSALFVLGCQSDNGGQSGDFSGDNDEGGPTHGGNGCKDTETPIDAGDDSQLGFSGDDVAALAAQSFTAPITWRAQQ